MQSPDRYEILESIARGDFATVYRGRDHELSREVAIKQIHQQYLDDPQQLDRYWQEAQLLAALQNPHIMTIYDVVRERGWLILELANGSLPQLLEGRGIDLKDLRLTLTYALHGLKAMHEAGIVHGDIKPGNLLVDRNQRIKLGDFGIARRLEGDGGSVVKGTTKYIAPEVVSDQFGPVGPHSDLYSLGFTAYELMCGEHFETLFPGLNMYGRDKQIAWMMWHSAGDRRVPDVTRVLEGVPPDLAHVVQRLVEKDPAKRYQTADEVLGDLNAEGEAPPSLDDTEEEQAAEAEANQANRKRSLLIAVASCSIVLSLAMLLLPNSAEIKGQGEDKGPKDAVMQPAEGVIVEIDPGRNRFFLELADGGPAQGVTVDPQQDRIFLNQERVAFGSLLKEDLVHIDYLSGSSGAFKEIYATRELSTQDAGELLAFDGAAATCEITLDDGTTVSAVCNDITKCFLNGQPVAPSELQPEDRVTLEHRGNPDGGRIALRIDAMRTESLEGLLMSAEDGQVVVSHGGPANAEERTFPLAADCEISLNGQRKDDTGRPLSTYDLRANDRVTLAYDVRVQSIKAVRDVSETAVVTEIDYEKRSFVADVETTAEPSSRTFIIPAGCQLQVASDPVSLYFLRVGDRVSVERKSPDPLQREAAQVTITPRPDPSAWAIVVSYQKYDNPALPEIPFATADATQLVKTLRLHYRIPDDQLQHERDATRLRLENQFKQFLPRVSADAQLLVYFLGHGHIDSDGAGYLVPQGFDSLRAASTGLPLPWLIEQLEQCPAKERLLVLDTTHAVSQVPGKYPSAVQLAESVKDGPQRPVSAAAFVIGGCDTGQFGNKGDGHGLLARAMTNALAGGADLNRNHRVDANELFSFVSRQVATQAAAADVQQTPKLFIPDATPPRLSNDAKAAILSLLAYLHRRIDDNMAMEYNRAHTLSAEQPDAGLAMGLVLMKANRLSAAEDVLNQTRLQHPDVCVAYHALAWKAFWEGKLTEGVRHLEQLAQRLPQQGDANEQRYAGRAFEFAGRLSAFGELVKRELKTSDVQGMRQAIAARGEAAKTAYRAGYFAVRDRLAKVTEAMKTESDSTKRSRLERDRNRISYYVEMDYDAPEAYLRTGLDR